VNIEAEVGNDRIALEELPYVIEVDFTQRSVSRPIGWESPVRRREILPQSLFVRIATMCSHPSSNRTSAESPTESSRSNSLPLAS
jgi:hypothetical protein